jgi:hypothetical protein
MRVLVYICVALWISVGIVIFVSNMILDAQMVNNLAPKPSRTFTGHAGIRSKPTLRLCGARPTISSAVKKPI